MISVTTRAGLQHVLGEARAKGLRIGFVPTMGYLHEGHLSLVDVAAAAADLVVMSIFVNPLQFGPGEDLERYPRDPAGDARAAAGRGVDIVFSPTVDEMYPDGEPAVIVDAPALAGRLCGPFRPGHFRGVLTVVCKLFAIARPDVAVFGRKDFQQLVLIRRMVRDLDMPVEVLAGPIVRESDGLALSSRNVYLDGAERREATLIHQSIIEVQAAFAGGERDAAALAGVAAGRLAAGRSVRPQYIELVNPESLDPVTTASPGDVIAIAAHIGRTRLIDNHQLTGTPT